MRAPLLEIVERVVLNRDALMFQYQGHERLVSPHLLGKTADGRYVIHGFQFGGASSKGQVLSPSEGAWRFFYADQIPEMSVTVIVGHPFHPTDTLHKTDIVEAYKPPKFIAEVVALAPRE